MSRHRNIRSMDYNEEYDGYFDVYGHSVDDDYAMSPSSVEREFIFDRSRQQNMAAFLHPNATIAEENETDGAGAGSGSGGGEDSDQHERAGRQDSSGPVIPDDLVGEQRAVLLSCLDSVRDVVGETVPDRAIVQAIIRHNYSCERALDDILASAMAGLPGSGVPKPPAGSRSRGTPPPGPALQPAAPPGAIKARATAAAPSAAAHPPAAVTPAASSTKQQPPASRVIVGFQDGPKSESQGGPLQVPEVRELKAGSASGPNSPNSSRRSSPSRPSADGDTSAPGGTPLRTPAKSRDVQAEYDKERSGGKQLINLVVIGHVDAGKSTLMGHLLYQLGCVNQKTMHKFENESKKIGKQSFKYAWVLDETGEERTRGITMDVGQFRFETPQKQVTLLDAPGHKDFIPNMITGAAAADAAVLVVNSTKGEFETGFELGGQTREHAILARSLGVSQLVVAVNKLDTVKWCQERYSEIRQRLAPFLRTVGFKESDIQYVPCSGLTGENLTKPAQQPGLTEWYTGPTLLQVIDGFAAPVRALDRPLRLCVSDVFKGQQQSGISVSGKIDAGMIQTGDKVMVMPLGETAVVRGMTIDESPVQSAFAGDHVTLTLANVDPQTLTMGVVLCDPAQPVRVATKVQARIVIFNIDLPITKGYQVMVHYQSLCEPAVITRLTSQLHRSTGEVLRHRPRCLSGNSSALVTLTFQRPLCVELYRDFREYGRLMLRVAGRTIAAGLITEIK